MSKFVPKFRRNLILELPFDNETAEYTENVELYVKLSKVTIKKDVSIIKPCCYMGLLLKEARLPFVCDEYVKE